MLLMPTDTPPPPNAELLASANRVLAALFAGGIVSVQVLFLPPDGTQRRYWAAIVARRTPEGAVMEEHRPRRLDIHPARTFGCGGAGPAADPKMPLPVLDRMWVLALRNYVDGLPACTPGQRLPADALAWLAAHLEALPAACSMTLDDLRALLARAGMLEPPDSAPWVQPS